MSLDRPPTVSQRAHDIAQTHIHASGQSAAMLAQKRADAAEKLRRDIVKHEREQKRREFEHHAQDQSKKDEPEDGGSVLDVVV